jgi:hypothetical protein
MTKQQKIKALKEIISLNGRCLENCNDCYFKYIPCAFPDKDILNLSKNYLKELAGISAKLNILLNNL